MSDIYKPSKWMNSEQHEMLLEFFFKNSPVKIDWNFHGSQTIDEDTNQLVFGPWAGPLQCITHIIHEMGHLAEIDDKRILCRGWGLSTPEQYIPGRYSHMAPIPVSFQPSERECRVIAMQWQIQNYLGIEETPRESISALKFMPDFCNVPRVHVENFSGWSQHDEERLVFLENKMIEYSKGKYTLEFFLQEWNRKNELLRKAMKD